MLPASVQKLIEQFDKLPGIGPKTAERLCFWLLKRPQADLKEFAQSLEDAKKDLVLCSKCHNISESDPCVICSDLSRETQIICVIAETHDLQTIERLKEYKGLYHILGGVINRLEGIGPESLNIETLVKKIKNQQIKEVILALNPDMEGESTSLYLQKLLNPLKVKITKLARGLPTGSDIEYADDVTLSSALKDRKEIR